MAGGPSWHGRWRCRLDGCAAVDLRRLPEPIQEEQRHGVRPTESILRRILAASAAPGRFEVVFFDQLAFVGVDGLHGGEEAGADLAREGVLSVALETGESDPLQ